LFDADTPSPRTAFYFSSAPPKGAVDINQLLRLVVLSASTTSAALGTVLGAEQRALGIEGQQVVIVNRTYLPT